MGLWLKDEYMMNVLWKGWENRQSGINSAIVAESIAQAVICGAQVLTQALKFHKAVGQASGAGTREAR